MGKATSKGRTDVTKLSSDGMSAPEGGAYLKPVVSKRTYPAKSGASALGENYSNDKQRVHTLSADAKEGIGGSTGITNLTPEVSARSYPK